MGLVFWVAFEMREGRAAFKGSGWERGDEGLTDEQNRAESSRDQRRSQSELRVYRTDRS